MAQNSAFYQHQREALDLGLQDLSYVVTTSTGSGKSLTYLLPIYDAIIRNNPSQHSVRALLIYPDERPNQQPAGGAGTVPRTKTGLIPQYALPATPARPARKNETSIQEEPPHILLTNYVMAEYLLLRPSERPMLQTARPAICTRW